MFAVNTIGGTRPWPDPAPPSTVNSPALAAAPFVSAWQLTADSGILRTVAERVALLAQVASEYRRPETPFKSAGTEKELGECR